MDRGPWRAAVYKVTKSWTRLKGLSMLHMVGHEKLDITYSLLIRARLQYV